MPSPALPSNTLFFRPSSPSSSQPSSLIFFIPGNPGLVSYYDLFLRHLAASMSSSPSPSSPNHSSTSSIASSSPSSQPPVSVCGTSLANFGSRPDTAGPLDLQQMVHYVTQQLRASAKALQAERETQQPVRVVLVGHSVGAYIAMSVLSRWRDERASPMDRGEGQGEEDGEEDGVQDGSTGLYEIEGVIGLWPTLTWIAESQSGRRLGWILSLPFVALLAYVCTWLISVLIPAFVVRRVIALMTQFPKPAAQTTTDFIRHPHAVRQALHLARHEMDEIRADMWADNLWHAGEEGPKVHLIFGEEDHWVGGEARDELMATRRATEEKPGATMEVDEMGIPHGFCIRDSEAVAGKTAKVVRGMLDQGWAG